MAQDSIVITIPTARTTIGTLAIAAGFKQYEGRARRWAICYNDTAGTARVGISPGRDPASDTVTLYPIQLIGSGRNDFILPFDDPCSLDDVWCVASSAYAVGLIIQIP